MTALERYYQPFQFEEGKENSEFQIIEILEDNEYKYGFEYNKKCIVAEWLYKKNLKTNRTCLLYTSRSREIISIIRWIIWIIISSCLVVAPICRKQATRMEPWHLQPGYLRMTRV